MTATAAELTREEAEAGAAQPGAGPPAGWAVAGVQHHYLAGYHSVTVVLRGRAEDVGGEIGRLVSEAGSAACALVRGRLCGTPEAGRLARLAGEYRDVQARLEMAKQARADKYRLAEEAAKGEAAGIGARLEEAVRECDRAGDEVARWLKVSEKIEPELARARKACAALAEGLRAQANAALTAEAEAAEREALEALACPQVGRALAAVVAARHVLGACLNGDGLASTVGALLGEIEDGAAVAGRALQAPLPPAPAPPNGAGVSVADAPPAGEAADRPREAPPGDDAPGVRICSHSGPPTPPEAPADRPTQEQAGCGGLATANLFVAACCVTGEGQEASVPELFACWSDWCARHGRDPGNEQLMGKLLRSAVDGLKESRPRTPDGRVRVYQGVGLRPTPLN